MRPFSLSLALTFSTLYTLAQLSSSVFAEPLNENAKPDLVMESGHHKPVMSIAFGPGSQWLVSASQDTTLILWDLVTRRELRTFAGHAGLVEKADVTSDGKVLVSAATDGAVKLWDIETGRELSSLSGRSPVWSLALSPDGQTVAAGSKDGMIRVWPILETRKFKVLREPDEVTGLAFGSNGEWLAAAAGKNVDVWRIRNGERMQVLAGHRNVVFGSGRQSRREVARVLRLGRSRQTLGHQLLA